jgi:hypothetical protein
MHVKEIEKSPFIPLFQRGQLLIFPSLKKRGERRFYVS